jgi:hypothetical protein
LLATRFEEEAHGQSVYSQSIGQTLILVSVYSRHRHPAHELLGDSGEEDVDFSAWRHPTGPEECQDGFRLTTGDYV